MAIPLGTELLGIIFLVVGHGEIGAVVGCRHCGVVLLDHHRQTYLHAGIAGCASLLLRLGLLVLPPVFCLLLVLLLKRAYKRSDLLGFGGCTENFARIVFQRANPTPDIGDMLSWIVADAELLAEHQRCDFRSEFFARVGLRAKGMSEVLAIKSRRVARRVTNLMQCRGVK